MLAPSSFYLLLLLSLFLSSTAMVEDLGAPRTSFDLFAAISSNLLLFFLILGMSASISPSALTNPFEEPRPVFITLFLQFVCLPFFGYSIVSAFSLAPAPGLTLLVLTSSPGGSYSNLLCSFFNTDLPLSITMTSISTLLSAVFLPLNLLLYSHLAYESSAVSELNWIGQFKSVSFGF